MYGIPNMKLDKGVVERRVSLLAAEGVAFVTGVEVGQRPARPTSCGRSSTRSCCAAARPRRATSPVEGRDLAGIHFAMEFLHENTKSLLDSNLQDGQLHLGEGQATSSSSAAATPAPTASAPRCATAAGASCSSRSCRGRRTSARADNPWPQWPKVYRSTTARRRRRRSSAPTRAHFCVQTQALRRRRRRAREGDRDGAASSG